MNFREILNVQFLKKRFMLGDMTKISVLPDFVIDQIAAGEVLENPSSAVKEMVENAIDAQASEITISIEGGGLQRIVIEDNGCGMKKEDALLCLKRHATSKIRSVDDLMTLKTMGFRGEALAALASVSRLELITKAEEMGTKVVVSGGDVLSVEPFARNQGTRIMASSLFFNAPARLKFQKSSASCSAACLKVVQSIALAHPEIAFKLFSNQKLVLDLKATEWKKRSEEIWGPFFKEIQRSGENLSLKGLLGHPQETKINRSGQWIFVNRRPIFSPLLSKAVKEGYGTRILDSSHPQFLIFLDLPADLVDVNVHPQKKEVRFSDESKVFSFVRNAVDGAFGNKLQDAPILPWDLSPPQILENGTFHFSTPTPFHLSLPFELKGRAVALLDPFLIIEEEKWKLIDLKGALARIFYEKMEKKERDIEPLLFPYEMEMENAEEMAEQLKEFGIDVRALGKKMVLIDALPKKMEIEQAIDFIQNFKVERKFAASLTKSYRISKKSYSFEEAKWIWQELKNCKESEIDPLGKKIVVPMDLKEFFS